MHTKSKTIAGLLISTELLIDLLNGMKGGFSGRYKVTENAIPNDAVVVGCRRYDDETIQIIIESDDFDEIEDGEDLPILEPPWFEAVQDDAVSKQSAHDLSPWERVSSVTVNTTDMPPSPFLPLIKEICKAVNRTCAKKENDK